MRVSREPDHRHPFAGYLHKTSKAKSVTKRLPLPAMHIDYASGIHLTDLLTSRLQLLDEENDLCEPLQGFDRNA